MSRIGQLLELKSLRSESEALKLRVAAAENRAEYLLAKYLALAERIEALEAKRGPGRLKNDERITAGGH